MEFLMLVAYKRAFSSNTLNSCVAEPFLAMLSLFEIGCPPNQMLKFQDMYSTGDKYNHSGP